MKSKLLSVLSIPLLLLSSMHARADDTEIYLNGNSAAAGKPLVMLALDYRSNLASTVCNGYSENDPTSECFEFFRESDGAGGYKNKLNDVPLDPGQVKFYEMLVAALNVVMTDLINDPNVGEDAFRLGLMMNHQDTTTGQCDAGPAVNDNRGNLRACSNGGYMFLGFQDMNQTYLKQFLGKMLELNTSEFIEPNAPNHPYQGAELYFEFFRYLTGQDVYNGHKGYDDFTSPDDSENVGFTAGFYPASVTTGLAAPVVPATGFDNPQIGWDATIESGFDAATYETNYSDTGTYTYLSPLLEECTKIFVINFMFQVSQQENDSDDAIEEIKADQGLDITVSNSNAFVDVLRAMYNYKFDDGTWGTVPDRGGTANVTSYFFVDPTKINNTTTGYAAAGGTVTPKALSEDPAQLTKDIKETFTSILSISTTFVSATVPVNVFNRSESLDNVFFGVFEAEETPQWPGNVKRLRLRIPKDPVTGESSGVLQVVDSTCPGSTADTTACSEAIADDGRIENSALTYWTDATSFEITEALGTVAGRPLNGYDVDKDELSGTDGRSVARGGAGQNIGGFGDDAPADENSDGKRQLFTENAGQSNGTANAMLALDGDATTAEAVWDDICNAIQGVACTTWADAASTDSNSDGATSANDQEAAVNLLLFARGIDVYDRDGDLSTSDSRPWLFGDILHAQPAPINYGATSCEPGSPYCNTGGYDVDNPELYVMTAGNDGYVRMIRNTTSTSTDDGSEVWAFMPREVMDILADQAGDSAANAHPYGVDGAISIYTEGAESDGTIDSGEGDKAYAFFGLRRGGKAYYALDISDPDDPKIQWKIAKTTGGDFDELGQTWSRPRVRQMIWDTDDDGDFADESSRTVVIFAGGYDEDKDLYENLLDASLTGSGDINENNQYQDDEGTAVYIVDALDGSLVWKAYRGGSTGADGNDNYSHTDMHDSIASDVTPVDTDGDGNIDRIYVGDTGGVVWRADLGERPKSQWTITPILSVGRHAEDTDGNSLNQPDRRFFHRPDVVPANDEYDGSVKYFGVLIGSGNRPFPRSVHPDDTSTTPSTPQYDQFYAYKDKALNIGTPPASISTQADLANMTSTDYATLNTACGLNPSATECNVLALLQEDGWYFNLVNDDGEKLLASSITFFGQTFFSTYVPSGGANPGSCAPPEGSAYTYVVNLEDGSPVYTFGGTDIPGKRSTLTGSGIPSDPVLIALDGEIFITPGNIPKTEEFRRSIAKNPLRKTYWYESSE